jgi:hypothetical protein
MSLKRGGENGTQGALTKPCSLYILIFLRIEKNAQTATPPYLYFYIINSCELFFRKIAASHSYSEEAAKKHSYDVKTNIPLIRLDVSLHVFKYTRTIRAAVI